MVDKNEVPGETPAEQHQPPPSKLKQPARKKVTAEDVQAKFEARKAARVERKTNSEPREMGKLVRIVAASLMGVGIIAMGAGITSSNEQHTVEVSANESEAAALAGAINELTPAEGEDTAQELVDGLAAAQTRSDELAAAQQEFAGIFHAGNSEPSANDGTPGASALASLEHRRALVVFFDPGSLILTDDEAYTFRTERLLSPGEIDPRQPWYTRYSPVAEPVADEVPEENAPGQLVMPPDSYTWETSSVTLSGTPGVMLVVWTNTDTESGDLLAWATARYSVETNTFSSLRVDTTTQGAAQQLRVDTPEPATEPSEETGA